MSEKMVQTYKSANMTMATPETDGTCALKMTNKATAKGLMWKKGVRHMSEEDKEKAIALKQLRTYRMVEWCTRITLIDTYLIGEIDHLFYQMNEEIKDTKYYRHEVKKAVKDLKEDVSRLMRALRDTYTEELTDIVYYKTQLFRKEHNKYNILESDVMSYFSNNLKELMLKFWSTTKTAVYMSISDDEMSGVVTKLFQINGLAHLGKMFEETLIDTIKEWFGNSCVRDTKAKMLFDTVQGRTNRIIEKMKVMPYEICTEDDHVKHRWYSMMKQCLNDINTAVLRDETIGGINGCIARAVEDYYQFMCGHLVMLAKKGKLEESVKAELRKFCKEKGQMFNLYNELRRLSKCVEDDMDEYDVSDAIEKLDCPELCKFLRCLKIEEEVWEKSRELKEKVDDALGKVQLTH